MASPSTPSVAELTANLNASRAALRHSVTEIEDRLNVPRRIREEVASHPLKWIALGAGVGFAALKAIPLVLRLTRKTWAGALISPLVQTAAAMALPVAADALHRFMNGRNQTPPPVPPFRTLPPDLP